MGLTNNRRVKQGYSDLGYIEIEIQMLMN